MEKAKLLIEELSRLTGNEIEFSQDGVSELAVEDRLLMLRYRPQDEDWRYFGFSSERKHQVFILGFSAIRSSFPEPRRRSL